MIRMDQERSSEKDQHSLVLKHKRVTQERVEKYLSDIYFTDVNLKGRLYPHQTRLQSIKWFKAVEKIAYQDAVDCLQDAEEVGEKLHSVLIGPVWSTHWFKCDMVIPKEWSGHQVRFRWDSNCEAMVWQDGQPVQGLTGSSDKGQLRTDFILTKKAQGDERYILYIEAAANGMFGVGHNGLINPPDERKQFPIAMAEIAVFDQDVYDLIMDLTVLYDMSKFLPEDSPRVYDALYAANEIINSCNPFDSSTFSHCRAIAAKVLGEKNGDSQHIIHAMGHCHIDSAWLWPYSESIRKCARSWTSVLRLMNDYPDFTFVCSQAQQFEWVKQNYPILYKKIKGKVSEGRFIPVGGSWIEMDGNIPSGESFVRQFLIGQKFFQEEFGKYCKEFWLPDTFGYSAQLPQIMNDVGIKYFLSQKLSWNLTNKFPHNTFVWEGLDGSRVLAHFPPADTYASKGDVHDLLKTVTEFKDKGRSRNSILLFGYGDGGGGPHENMLEFLKRLGNVDSIPKVKHSSPDEYFDLVASKDASNLCKWVGELYLELHRGTYTTQAKIKQENRKGEFLLHDVDFVVAMVYAKTQDSAALTTVQAELLPLWKKFLLNQFHDVLPGSCIEQVAKDALTYYEEVKDSATKILMSRLDHLLSKVWERTSMKQAIVMNTFSWQRHEVVCLSDGINQNEDEPNEPKKPRLEQNCLTQVVHDGSEIALVSVEPVSFQMLKEVSPQHPVTIQQEPCGDCVLENEFLRAVITKGGLLKSLLHKSSTKEAVEPGKCGNQFVLFDDVPLFWDAWDVMEYHLETRQPLTCNSHGASCVLDTGPLRVSVQVDLDISKHSSISQTISLDSNSPYLRFETKVNWQEKHKFLKVEFPFNVHSHEAKYEIQFGHVSRPNHFNTSWDQAKFEVCGHKWADISEHGFGVALLNESKYGYSTIDNVMRLSLLRSSKAPDANADIGSHSFSYAIMPHSGSLQEGRVIQQAYNFNHPLKIVNKMYSGDCYSLFSVDNPAVILETIKPPVIMQTSPAIILRMYEAYGSNAKVIVNVCLPVKCYQRCNLLEDPVEDPIDCDGSISLCLKPFQIVTIMLRL